MGHPCPGFGYQILCIALTQYVARKTIVITRPITKVFINTSLLSRHPYALAVPTRRPNEIYALRGLTGWVETSWMGSSNNFMENKTDER